VKRERKLINADTDWVDLSSQPNEFWYIRDGQKLFQSNLPLDINNIKTDRLILDYQFPLSLKSNWCLISEDLKSATPQDNAGCDFENCYDLVDYYNGGNIFHKFCSGVGIVFMKFDHSGSRFGFEQTLTSYTKGTP
jgi:hypothetical protein